MTTLRNTRRRMLAVAASAGIASLVLAGCSTGETAPGSSDDVTLTVMAWANAEESAMWEEVFDIYEDANPGIKITFEGNDVGTYRDVLNTKYAAGSPPDVFYLVGQWMGEYVERDALMDFTAYGDDIDLASMNAGILESQEIDGALYGIPTGSTAIGLLANTKVLGDLGIALPDDANWSWDDFITWSTSVTEASDGATHGSYFDAAWLPTFSTYVREHGEDVFDQEGNLAVSESTVRAWFEQTREFFDSGAFPGPETIDQSGAIVPEESPIAKEQVATAIIPTNTIGGYAAALGEGNYALLRLPGDSTEQRLGIAVTPTLVWSAAASSPHAAEAAKLVDWLTNDLESYDIRGTYLGVPINASVADSLAATLKPDEEMFVSYTAALLGEDRAPYYMEPAGAGAVSDALLSIVTELAFDRASPADAASRFMTDAQTALDNAVQ